MQVVKMLVNILRGLYNYLKDGIDWVCSDRQARNSEKSQYLKDYMDFLEEINARRLEISRHTSNYLNKIVPEIRVDKRRIIVNLLNEYIEYYGKKYKSYTYKNNCIGLDCDMKGLQSEVDKFCINIVDLCERCEVYKSDSKKEYQNIMEYSKALEKQIDKRIRLISEMQGKMM